MSEFFRGWKRKAGCATLVLACVVAGEWVRTLEVSDYLGYDIHSAGGHLQCYKQYYLVNFVDGNGNETDTRKEFGPLTYIELKPTIETGSAFGKYIPDGRDVFWSIPYWSVVLPLALLSAWLILSKPKPKSA